MNGLMGAGLQKCSRSICVLAKWSAVTLLGGAGVQNASASFLPPNNLHLQDNIREVVNISQQEFNSIVDTIIEYYKPIVSAKGATLKSNNLWDNVTVNASAQQMGSTWIVNMYGGLARRPEITADGFSMVVCHELGHHLGGYPFKSDDGWSATEGEADYFATQSCAREIWRQQTTENARFRDTVSSFEKRKCDAIWARVEDQDLCYRTAAAGQSLASLLAVLRANKVLPRFDTPDMNKVTTTFTGHPEAQCRLDTYLSGALCAVSFDKNIIPGRNTAGSQMSKDAELKAATSSCMASSGYVDGVRPLCWFKPQLDVLPLQ